MTTPAAGRATTTGASLRVDDVCRALVRSGFVPEVVQRADVRAAAPACLGVVVSYVGTAALRSLRAQADALWLDAVDSWLEVDLSGLRARHPSYLARLLRDGARLAAAPTVDLVTYISAADRRADRSSVRGRRRLVLPGTGRAIDPLPQQGSRAVLAGDWGYPPNRDGLRWFVAEVLPTLERLRPEPSWHVDVYGLHAPALPGRLRAHGYAPEDELYRRGDVHLAPVHHGGGVKRKVLQALLAGLPVVTTAVGAHGLRPHPQLHVTTSPEEFAQATAARLTAPTSASPPRLAELVDGDDTAAVLDWLVSIGHGCCDRTRRP